MHSISEHAKGWAHSGDLKKAWAVLQGTKAAKPIDTFGFLPDDRLNTGQLLLNQLRADMIKDINTFHVYHGVSFVVIVVCHRLTCYSE
jgi:hypothetical protein